MADPDAGAGMTPTAGPAAGDAHGGGQLPATGSNAAWFERATRTIPGGVDSPVRSFASVGGTPFTVGRGEGPWVFDVEGRRYLDLVQSYGAVLLGHAHPVVVEAVCRAASLGSSFGMPTPGEVLLAEAICERVPGCEQVRFVSSGTEAAMSALRLARGVTGRSRVVKFDGCYHGHSDGLLAGGGSGVATLGLPGSAGVPSGAVADSLVTCGRSHRSRRCARRCYHARCGASAERQSRRASRSRQRRMSCWSYPPVAHRHGMPSQTPAVSGGWSSPSG